MKISLIHFAGPPVIGGVESVMGHHARLMADDGHEVTIFAGRGGHCDKRVKYTEMPLLDSKNPDVLKLKQELDIGIVPANFEEIKQQILSELCSHLESMDVLFVHNVFTMAKNLALTAALRELENKLPQLKIVAWHHDLAARSSRYENELYPKWPWNLMTANWDESKVEHVAVSSMRKKELSSFMQLDEQRVAVIPSGIDENILLSIDSQSRKIFDDLELAKHFPLILLPVRITRRKNIEMALRIASKLSGLYPEAALVITGPPGAHNLDNSEYFTELKKLSKELGLSSKNNVFFLAEKVEGFLPDAVIADLYKCADCLLITSVEEGFGIPIIEAALSRVPIFCSELPPFKEIAGDIPNYFQLDDEPKEVAQRIAKHIDGDTTHLLRKKIRDTFSWSAVYTQLLEPLLEKKNG